MSQLALKRQQHRNQTETGPDPTDENRIAHISGGARATHVICYWV
jgi:hypothetical protein